MPGRRGSSRYCKPRPTPSLAFWSSLRASQSATGCVCCCRVTRGTTTASGISCRPVRSWRSTRSDRKNRVGWTPSCRALQHQDRQTFTFCSRDHREVDTAFGVVPVNSQELKTSEGAQDAKPPYIWDLAHARTVDRPPVCELETLCRRCCGGDRLGYRDARHPRSHRPARGCSDILQPRFAYRAHSSSPLSERWSDCGLLRVERAFDGPSPAVRPACTGCGAPTERDGAGRHRHLKTGAGGLLPRSRTPARRC